MIVAQFFQVYLDLTNDLTFTVCLHILHLHLQILNASQNIERDNFIPDGVISSWDFLRIWTVLFHA